MSLKGFIKTLKYKTGRADCSEYFDLVQLVLDDESTSEQEAYLRRHMKRCLGCFEYVNLEKELKMVLKQKLERKPVPKGLADSIRENISKSA